MELQQMEQEDEEALMQAQGIQAIPQEDNRSTPQPTGEEEGAPIQEEEWEVEEEEMRRIQEEEMTLAQEEQQEQRETQIRTEPDQARREVGMPLQNAEEPQNAQGAVPWTRICG
ncbi:hypothetical protein CYMTET_55943 [Cymbomonas tetramitiformis]|uniref:Uncharacterized protein n=1 Tax=Cymbomonas tetramitiformis TaxID=36881 RepID=A0AAE0BD45_9CHLO|nr:hypothetical protein CYMTET_55943 [Cymbomonas tetramitiformis]